jgi:hypothetical protein
VALVCELCQTANRDGAKFCKGCGRKIAQSWPGAEGVALSVGGDVLALSGATATSGTSMGAASGGFSAGTAHVEPAGREAPAYERPTAALDHTHDLFAGQGPKRRWVMPLVVGAVLVTTSAWFALSHRGEVVDQAARTAPAVVVPAPVQAPEPAATPSTDPASSAALPTVGAPGVADSTLKAPTDELEEPKPKPARKPVARPRPPEPPPVPARPPLVVAPPLPAPPTPQQACAGLNFVAKARCLSEQCARAEQQGHPQCQAVREQQRLEEEKRNPQLAS